MPKRPGTALAWTPGVAEAKQRFVGKTIPLVLAAFALAFAGVLTVDLFIEHRQVEASTHVARSTISTVRAVTEFGRAMHDFNVAAAERLPDEPAALTSLLAARSRLVEAMDDFEEHVSPDEQTTWRSSRARIEALEGTTPLEDTTPVAALDRRVRALQGDLAAITAMADRRGIAALQNAQRLHTLEGALEGCVFFFLASSSLALLVGWRHREALARERDAQVEAQLRRTLADLDGFAGRVAHDLRSPLSPILAGSQWIERAPVTDAVRAHAERIERSARRLARMIDALLQYTRLSATATSGSVTPVNAATEEILADFDELVGARGGRIDADLGQEATLACAPETVQSIVANLVDNALKYGTKEGAPPHVTVRTRVEGPSCVIEVEDRGPGVPPELREQIFRPLFRGQKHGVGIGLGLSIVQRLVEAHHGRIEVLDGAEGGALFRVLLPLAEAASRGEAEAGPTEKPSDHRWWAQRESNPRPTD